MLVVRNGASSVFETDRGLELEAYEGRSRFITHTYVAYLKMQLFFTAEFLAWNAELLSHPNFPHDG